MAEVTIAPNQAPATRAARAAGSRMAVALTFNCETERVEIWCHGDTEGLRVLATALADVVSKALEVSDAPEWVADILDFVFSTERDHG
ncbi:MAG: hypothetical protein K9H25_23085 [Rhodospirillum sp.]|nr:hypothetical protein [Rhodospirillum sp.]MCF8491379.1 hypothetical protein [Rhodospirillum sp.]MCF8500203.1 hypothetical protein [Rhodospirillum sp.]